MPAAAGNDPRRPSPAWPAWTVTAPPEGSEMFERFTERARRVVVFAQEEARELNHSYIGTEHLLLGLMRDAGSVAAQALHELEISQDAVRERVTEIIGRGQQAPSGHIPFTPRAKKVLELSLREALQLNHNYIGTEHILLGLVREGEGVAAQVLIKLGGSLSRVRDKVIELAPPGSSEGPELSGQLRQSRLRGPLDELTRRLEAMDERLAAIERHLGLAGGPGAAAAGAGTGAAAGGPAEPGGGEQEPGGEDPGGAEAGSTGR
jgi:Clp amino terminal domain, pathogenicity island component